MTSEGSAALEPLGSAPGSGASCARTGVCPTTVGERTEEQDAGAAPHGAMDS